MARDGSDVAAMSPAMELTLQRPGTLRCTGTLDGRTRRPLFAAVEELLSWRPGEVDIDVSGLRLADRDGAEALVHVQRMALEAGARVHWDGLDARRLHLMRYLDLSESFDYARAMRAFPAAS